MKRHRDNKGKYKRNPKRFAKFLLLAIVFGMGIWTITSKPTEAPIEAPQPNIDALVKEGTEIAIQAKIKRLENDLLEQLSVGCETLNVEDPDGAIIYDSAARGDIRRMSIGRFMFQRRTIKHYVKKFEGRDITNHEAIEIAIDPELSTELARKVIFEAGEIKQNWYNCTIKHDLDTQVELIKKLYE